MTRGRTRAAHAAHLDTKPHNTLLIVRAPARLDLTPSPIMSLGARLECEFWCKPMVVGAHQLNDCSGARRKIEEGRSLS